MKKLILAFLILLSLNLFATKESDSLKIELLDIKTSHLTNKVDEVKRDQLNYKIEKEILLETYRINYERINLFISVVLGLIAILGYLGIKDINSIKKEYKSELDNLSMLRNDLESKYKDFENSKSEYTENISKIISQNEEQNVKIKVLEIREKVGSHISSQNYTHALEYIAIGLSLISDDTELLRLKAHTYFKTQQYADAISAYNELLKIDEKNQLAISDLSELYLISNDIEGYNNLVKNHRTIFSTDKFKSYSLFFDAFKLFQEKNTEDLKNYVNLFIKDKKETEKKRHISWSFEDVLIYLNNIDDSNIKNIFESFVKFLNGSLSVKELNKKIN